MMHLENDLNRKESVQVCHLMDQPGWLERDELVWCLVRESPGGGQDGSGTWDPGSTCNCKHLHPLI